MWRDEPLLRQAIALAARCRPSATAFSVGALIVDAEGAIVSSGYSRENHPADHAEEIALAKVAADDPRLARSTLYSSLEPCSSRASRPRSCTELIVASPVTRVVFAWREPGVFTDCDGAERLRAAGREVLELPHLADLARACNLHLIATS